MMGRRIRGTSLELDQEAQRQRRHPTVAESALWQRLRSRRLDGFKFRRQHALGQFILDFVCPSARLVIELDGEVHRHRGDSDAQRDEHLRAYGYRVLRFSNERVLNDLGAVLLEIRAQLHRT